MPWESRIRPTARRRGARTPSRVGPPAVSPITIDHSPGPGRRSSGPTLSWQLPNRSTHSTSAWIPSASSRGSGTMPGSSTSGSMAGRGRRGRRRCTGGRRPARTRRARRTWRPAPSSWYSGWSARRPARRRRRWRRPAPAGRCPARRARRRRRRPRRRRPAATSPHPGRRRRAPRPRRRRGWRGPAPANHRARRTGRTPWVRSITVACGARSRSTDLTTPTNSSSQP